MGYKDRQLFSVVNSGLSRGAKHPMIVMKFGGTSLADGPCLEHVASLVKSFEEPKALVVSALGKSTDTLLQLGMWAENGEGDKARSGLNALRLEHEEAFPDPENQAAEHDQLFAELSRLLDGIELLQEQTPRSRSLLVSFGERLSIHVVTAHLRAKGLIAEAIDARDLIETTDNGQNGPVDFVQSTFQCQEKLLPLIDDGVIPVITGFLARNKDGFTTTLGRGGSDYTATIIGQIMKAKEVWIWTDVSGILSADPRLVKNAHTLPQVSYREASEMSFFGAKVLHPKTIAPVARQNIPVRILNTFQAKDPGTLISADTPKSAEGVKTVATMHELALMTIEGRGMAGRPGIARRIFEATELASCNVVMISQASSEQSVSFVVSQSAVKDLREMLESRFAFELDQGLIESIGIVEPVAIASIIGLGMSGTPGISGRFFGALGKVGVNVLAIAQGATEMNISVALREDEAARAVRAAHTAFGLTRALNIVLIGAGRVGRTFLRFLTETKENLSAKLDLDLKLIAVANSRAISLDVDGLDPATVLDEKGLKKSSPRPDDAALIAQLKAEHMSDVVFIDVTAADTYSLHQGALDAGFHVVTANKIPLARELGDYQRLMTASRTKGSVYGFETTFGAGLPVLHTLLDLVQTGDSFENAVAALSGTLGHICTSLQDGLSLKESVDAAADAGYTEPDPREDLSGRDVQRKALIIARAAGLTLNIDDIPCEPLVPNLEQGLDSALREYQPILSARIAKAKSEGRVLRYLAEITPEGASVGLREVEADSVLGRLAGPDNIMVFRTARYKDYPLVIQGPGAGVEVTAAGILGDVLKVTQRL